MNKVSYIVHSHPKNYEEGMPFDTLKEAQQFSVGYWPNRVCITAYRWANGERLLIEDTGASN